MSIENPPRLNDVVTPFHTIPHYFTTFYRIQNHSLPFHTIPFHSQPFHIIHHIPNNAPPLPTIPHHFTLFPTIPIKCPQFPIILRCHNGEFSDSKIDDHEFVVLRQHSKVLRRQQEEAIFLAWAQGRGLHKLEG